MCNGCLPCTTELPGYTHDCISEMVIDDVPHSEGCPYGLSWGEIFDRFKHGRSFERKPCARPSCADPFAMRWT